MVKTKVIINKTQIRNKQEIKEQKEKEKLEKKEQKEREKQEKEREKEQKEREKKEQKEQKEKEKQEKKEKEKLEKLEKQEKKEQKKNIINDENNETLTNMLNTLVEKKRIKNNYEPIYNIIKRSDNVINKIIHIADIHIRLTSYHNEYNNVFSIFYDELREYKKLNPNTLICICGDLLHSKNELTPDSILVTWDFLKNLSDIFTVIIITGNHDMLETNDDKVDSISAILKDRPIDNIHYLTKSGVYEYNNIIFGLSSIIDKYTVHIDKLNEIIDTNSDIYDIYDDNVIKKIGLYHGAVGTIITDVGVRLKGDRSLEDFGKYDYILLGDIHKFQYLDEAKTVAYSSSLISQNFTETDKYHGYLEWDIINHSSNYHILENENRYNKIDLLKILDEQSQSVSSCENNIDIEKMTNELIEMQNGFLRIDYEESYINKINKHVILEHIKTVYPKLTVSWYIKKTTNKLIISPEMKTNDIINMNSQYMDDLMISYMKNKYSGLSDELINKVLEYFKDILSKATTDDSGGSIEYVKGDWKILWLSFDNMYGYGPNNVIDFTKYPINEIIGIFGDNAVGKSSLIDIISYMLFTRSARDEDSRNPKDIININATKSQGVIIIESCNKLYYIKRVCYINKTKMHTNIKQNLELYEMTDVDVNSDKKKIIKIFNKEYYLRSLTEENRIITDRILQSVIGTYENFISTSVLLQGNNKTFRSKTNVQKKDFLCEILKIDHFKKVEGVITDKYKELKNKVAIYNKLSDTISDKTIDELVNENNLLDNREKTLNDVVNKLEEELNVYQNEVNDKVKQIINIKNMKNIDEVELEIKKKIDNINKYRKKINNIDDSIGKLLIDEDSINSINIEYNNILSELKEEENSISKEINDILNSKCSYQLTKIDSSLTLINQEKLLESKEIELSKLMDLCPMRASCKLVSNISIDEYKKMILKLKLINKKENIELENKIHINNVKLERDNITNTINDLTIKKQLIKFIDVKGKNKSILDKELNTINKYFGNIDIEKVISKIPKIKQDYDNLIKSNIDSLYTMINELDDKNVLERKDEIIDTLNIVFNKPTEKKHKLVDKYETVIELDKNLKNRDDILVQLKNIEMNEIAKKEQDELNNEINKNKDKIKTLKDNMDEYNELQEELKLELTYNKEINRLMCIENNKRKIEDEINKCKSNIEIIINNDKINQELKKLDDKVKELEKTKTNVYNNTEYKKLYEQTQKIIKDNILNTSYNKDKNDIDKLILNEEIELTDLRKEIKEIDDMKDIQEKNKQVEIEITKIRETIKDVSYRLKFSTTELIDVLNIKDRNTDTINKLEKQNKELNNLKKELEIYEMLYKISGRDGIQLYLLKTYLGTISDRVNGILEEYIDKKIELRLDDEKIELRVLSGEDSIHTLSGMESLMLDLIMKIIIGQVSIIPKSNLIFIDESISVLDKNRLASINELFMLLRQYYNNVYLITHMKQIKNHISHTLEITKENKRSFISNL